MVLPTSSERRPWRRVFYPTDFSCGAPTAYSHALRLAASLDAKLEIAHVTPQGRSSFENLPGVRDTLRAWRAAQNGSFPPSRIKVRKTTITGERVSSSLLGYLQEHPAELVVLTTQQRKGWNRLRQGETATRIARQASRAALVLPKSAHGFVDKDRGTYHLEQILVPIDHHPSPQATLDRLCGFLVRISIESPSCRLLHISNDHREPPEVRTPSSPRGVDWDYEIRSGDPAKVIVAAAREQQAGLLVLASEGRAGAGDALHGSMAERIIRQSEIPVLLLPRSRR